MKKITTALFITLLFMACSGDEDCRQQLYVVVGADMKKMVFDDLKEDYVSEDFTADSLTIFGLGCDSLLYNKAQIKTFDLPLQKTKEETHFVLYTNGIYDTLSFKHTNDTNYISMACGCLIQSTITDEPVVTHNAIDSVVLKEPLVINSRVANIEIYFKNN
mgnify:FL=1